MSKIILGIHSNTMRAKGNGGAGYSSVKNKPGDWSAIASGEKAEGHAWISLTENGAMTTYGLWPDSHPLVVDNGNGTDIRVGMEQNGAAAASRYYRLSTSQAMALRLAIQRNVTWRYTNNCSSWASAIVQEVVREDVNADDWGMLGIETPRQLGDSIRRMEQRDPTTIAKPRDISEQERSSTLPWGWPS